MGGLCIQPSRAYMTAFEKAFWWPETERAQQAYQQIATLCKRCDELQTLIHELKVGGYMCPMVIGELTVSKPQDPKKVKDTLAERHTEIDNTSIFFGGVHSADTLNHFWSLIPEATRMVSDP